MELAKKYLYFANDAVYDTWKSSDLRAWLVKHGFVKSDYQATRDEYYAAVRDKYTQAKDALWSGWLDSDMRRFLVDQHVITPSAVYTREDLVALMEQHAQSVAATARG